MFVCYHTYHPYFKYFNINSLFPYGIIEKILHITGLTSNISALHWISNNVCYSTLDFKSGLLLIDGF